MGLILDTNCFSHVFSSKDSKFDNFQVLRNWLLNGSGQLVYGGTKFIGELKKATKFLRLFSLLHKCGKAILIDPNKVDEEQKRIESLIKHPDFDDPHLPALVIVSGCRVICTQDERAIKFLKSAELYPRGVKHPKIYTSDRNKKLLSKRYVGAGCVTDKQNHSIIENAIASI